MSLHVIVSRRPEEGIRIGDATVHIVSVKRNRVCIHVEARPGTNIHRLTKSDASDRRRDREVASK